MPRQKKKEELCPNCHAPVTGWQAHWSYYLERYTCKSADWSYDRIVD